MSDRIIDCADCRRRFVWSAGEQRFYRERGLSAPKRCPNCVSRRRNEQRVGMRSEVGAPAKPPPHLNQRWGAAMKQARQPRQEHIRPQQTPQRARPHDRSWWDNPFYRHTSVAIGMTLILIVILELSKVSFNFVALWLIAINLVALAIYVYDKVIAGSKQTRMHEWALLTIAFLGGAPGAYIAMQVARHKTSKDSFIDKFRGVVVVQLVLIVTYYLLFHTQP
jgi:uncharacterized membrane protein YsdA (DUF1294 family)